MLLRARADSQAVTHLVRISLPLSYPCDACLGWDHHVMLLLLQSLLTPLHVAAHSGRAVAVPILAAAGALLDAADKVRKRLRT